MCVRLGLAVVKRGCGFPKTAASGKVNAAPDSVSVAIGRVEWERTFLACSQHLRNGQPSPPTVLRPRWGRTAPRAPHLAAAGGGIQAVASTLGGSANYGSFETFSLFFWLGGFGWERTGGTLPCLGHRCSFIAAYRGTQSTRALLLFGFIVRIRETLRDNVACASHQSQDDKRRRLPRPSAAPPPSPPPSSP